MEVGLGGSFLPGKYPTEVVDGLGDLDAGEGEDLDLVRDIAFSAANLAADCSSSDGLLECKGDLDLDLSLALAGVELLSFSPLKCLALIKGLC